MTTMYRSFALLAVAAALFAAGCRGGTTTPAAGGATPAAAGKDGLAQLGPEDRRLAEAQGVCPVSGEPLGSMGPPPKVTVGGQQVFLCCKACEKKALADPEKTLAKVKAPATGGQTPKQ